MIAHKRSPSFERDGQEEISRGHAKRAKTDRKHVPKLKAGRSMPQHCRGTAIMPSQRTTSKDSMESTISKEASSAGSARTDLAALAAVDAGHAEHTKHTDNASHDKHNTNTKSSDTVHSPRQKDPKPAKRAGAGEDIPPTKPEAKSGLEQLDGSFDPGGADTESEDVIRETYPGEYAELNKALDEEPNAKIRDAMVNHYFAESHPGVLLGMSGASRIQRKLRTEAARPHEQKALAKDERGKNTKRSL